MARSASSQIRARASPASCGASTMYGGRWAQLGSHPRWPVSSSGTAAAVRRWTAETSASASTSTGPADERAAAQPGLAHGGVEDLVGVGRRGDPHEVDGDERHAGGVHGVGHQVHRRLLAIVEVGEGAAAGEDPHERIGRRLGRRLDVDEDERQRRVGPSLPSTWAVTRSGTRRARVRNGRSGSSTSTSPAPTSRPPGSRRRRPAAPVACSPHRPRASPMLTRRRVTSSLR